MADQDKSNEPDSTASDSLSIVPSKYLYPFALVTTLFALWGFANQYTDPMVKAFGDIFLISGFKSALVQFAFYGGYATMAFPAALVIRKYSFKTGILIGLILYAIGAFLTIPAAYMVTFELFLISYYILTFGLAFLETSANPYILSLGSEETATRRLNLAQAFNPIGSYAGTVVAAAIILPQLQVASFKAAEREAHPEYATTAPAEVDKEIRASLEDFRGTKPEEHLAMQENDLSVVRMPYVIVGLVVIGVLVAFLVSALPDTGQQSEPFALSETVPKLMNFRYLGGVLAQGLYVGAQITVWTFSIHYGVTLLGMSASEAQWYNSTATLVFLVSRFLWTFVLKYISPPLLLASLAACAVVCCLGTVFIQGIAGMYCLIGISACFGVMFPTIYGIALRGLSVNDAKFGSAGLVFSIIGGALIPLVQGTIADMETVSVFGSQLEGVRASYLVPVVCLTYVVAYGLVISATDGRKNPTPESN